MSGKRASACTALTAILLLGLAGCGQGGPSQGEAEEAVARSQEAKERRALQARAPKGASPALRRLYSAFPPPKPDPKAKGSTKAIAEGERACKGKTPSGVKARFYPEAKENLEPAQRKLISRLPHYEAIAAHDPGFAAGQLAADVYAASLPAAVARYGYEGCVYGLARRLEGELGRER